MIVYRAEPTQHVRRRATVQSLGGRMYAIPDVSGRESTLVGKIIPLIALFLLPISVFVVVLYMGIMVVGPVSWRNAILARLIPFQMKAVGVISENQRKLLLQHVSGRVLDVGSGGGAYLPLLRGKASHVVALEPVTEMHPIIRKEATLAGFEEYQITILTDTVETYAASNLTASFDWVLLGNVLCEVHSQTSTLDHINKLLKDGGHVYFSEHVGYPIGTIGRRLQDVLNPLWRRASGGCNCNRDSLHAIEGMADWDVVSWEMKNFKSFLGAFVMGLAQKAAV